MVPDADRRGSCLSEHGLGESGVTDATTSSERKLGWGLASLLVAGNMIGAGVYLLPAALAPIGSSSVVGWVVAAIGALLLAGVFAGLGRARPAADGITDYAGQGLGRFFGYQASLAYWATCLSGNVAIAVAATGYLAFFFPVLREQWPGALCNIALQHLADWPTQHAPHVAALAASKSAALALGAKQ